MKIMVTIDGCEIDVMALLAEVKRLRAQQSMAIEVIDASDEMTAENERLRAALTEVRCISTKWGNSIPWQDGERLAQIAGSALNQQERRNLAPGDLSVEALKNTKMDARHEPLNALVDQQPTGRAAPDELTAETERLGLYDPPKEG
jgi:hypothetical protein